jgi:glycosyltransferase involved in cell wall biosynthesis
LGLSIAIISKNEEKNIGRTLESINGIADEIILVDSFSTDTTINIAQQYNCIVFQEEWKGFAQQKNSALEKCSQNLILSIDCDEVITEELRKSILKIIQDPISDISGYYINWRNVYLGKIMKHTWQPNYKLRLVKKSSHPHWEGEEIHEELHIDGESKKIRGELLHYSYTDLQSHFKKINDYAKISANKYNRLNHNFHFANLIINPIFAFIKNYFFKLGFLDGTRGLIAAYGELCGTFYKYAYLYEIKKGE